MASSAAATRSSQASPEQTEILEYIAIVRGQHPATVEIFTGGLCFHFFQILLDRFPTAEAWYDCNHVITRIGAHFYDITGEVECRHHIPMDQHFTEQLQLRRLKYWNVEQILLAMKQ